MNIQNTLIDSLKKNRMKIKKFIGIDVSKKTLDISIVDEHGNVIYYERIGNKVKEIKSSFSRFMRTHDCDYDDCVFCMEYTGIYNLPVVKWLQSQKAKIWLESGMQIKKSMGLVRGKNDKVDSARIAEYALSNRHKMKLWQAPREIVDKIEVLVAQRNRFIKAKNQLTVPVEELKLFLNKEAINAINKSNAKPVVALTESIKQIEKERSGNSG